MSRYSKQEHYSPDDPHELSNLKIEFVSAVDKPANRRPFLVAKTRQPHDQVDDVGGYITPDLVRTIVNEVVQEAMRPRAAAMDRSIGDIRRRMSRADVKCSDCGRFFRFSNGCDHGENDHANLTDQEGRRAPYSTDSPSFDYGQGVAGRKSYSPRTREQDEALDGQRLIDPVSSVVMSKDDEAESMVCPACGGSGLVDDERCRVCQGEGTMNRGDVARLSMPFPEGEDGADYDDDDDDDRHPREKAAWSQAFQDELPDRSFAYISPGGSRDSSGKTYPRSLRHLPYRSETGEPDAAHVRAALARLSQTDIPPEAKALALRRLMIAAHKVGVKAEVKAIGRGYRGARFDVRSLRSKHPKAGGDRTVYDASGFRRTRDGRHLDGPERYAPGHQA
jgi:hypothetical protein